MFIELIITGYYFDKKQWALNDKQNKGIGDINKFSNVTGKRRDVSRGPGCLLLFIDNPIK